MPTSKRKPAAKNAATPAPVEQAPAQEAAPKPEMPSEAEVQEMIREIFAPPEPVVHTPQEVEAARLRLIAQLHPDPPVSEETRVFAQTVRDYAGTRDVFFGLAPGVICLFGYSGLSRVMPAHRYVHIATVAELDAMSDQQIYDAVKQAGDTR